MPLKGEDVVVTFQRYIQERSPYPPNNLVIEVSPLKEMIILPDAQVSLAPVPPRNDKLMGDVTLEMVIMLPGPAFKAPQGERHSAA